MHLLHIVCHEKSLNSFVNRVFSNWHQITHKKSRHESNHYHQHARKTAEGVISRFKKPGTTISSQINATLNSRHNKYPQILKILARTIHLLGRQGLALKGHCESMEDRGNKDNNPGNFIEFLREIATYSPELAEHTEKPASRNATYITVFEITAGDRTKPGVLTLCPDISLQRKWKMSGHFSNQNFPLAKNNL